MTRRQLLGFLFRPSLSSAIMTLIVAGSVLIAASWSVITQSSLFIDYLVGPAGLITALRDSPDGTSAFLDTVFAGSLTYNLVVIMVAGTVGVVVYGLLQAFSRVSENFLSGLLMIRDAQGASKHTIETEVEARLGMRAVTVVLWLVYSWLFVKVILPFCMLSSYLMANSWQSWGGWLYGSLGFAILVGGLHVHVIFARLFFLRVRLFGISGV